MMGKNVHNYYNTSDNIIARLDQNEKNYAYACV